jgi:phytanoyl-CoA hydroxylase
MSYPTAQAHQIRFFQENGYLVVKNAIDPPDLVRLAEICDEILADKTTYASDWAWEKGTDLDKRAFKIVQAAPSKHWPELHDAPYRAWAVAFGSALMGKTMEFWYDQFLGKPPEEGATTYWHQDEAYWGRTFENNGITCWMPLHGVDETNGCMHFIRGGHRDGILDHRQPAHIQSDLLSCDVDEAHAQACPLRLGSVTFHHGRTPHMAGPNRSQGWRKALTQHLKREGLSGAHEDRDHYPWKISVDQFSGDRVKRGDT